MKKYLVLFLQTLSFTVTYRIQIILSLMQGFVTPFLMLVALSFASPMGEHPIYQLLSYYMIVGFLFPLIHSTVDEDVGELCNSGEINNFLSKPINVYTWLISKSLSEKISSLFYIVPIILLTIIAAGVWRTFLVNLPGMIISSIISFVIYFNCSFLVGLFSFWIDEFWAIRNLKHVIFQFFGGFILPISFFPDQLFNWVRYSPFYYLGSWNTAVYSGNLVISDIFIALLWIALTKLLINALQKKAISSYSFSGG